ncbi:3-hydroxyacyl-CoA dehydrogenase family protein [Desulfovibrio sp. OttesenSCG-928-F20]|nr:3-hydroxyacyl-CoA dehydrogenase family protein [Desulfovibrio sp. OttesenSCG-928-F20]
MPQHLIRTVACLGAGTMGHAVAYLSARAGYSVRLFARSRSSLGRALQAVEQAALTCENLGLAQAGEANIVLERILPVTDIAQAVHDADIVSESVAEDPAVKSEVFRELEKTCPAHAVLATNTSSLDLAAMSSVLRRPGRFVAAHFMNPPYLVPTVEICPAPETTPETLDVALRWVRSLGNTPLLLERAVQGFLVNRIQSACLREALYIVEQGWASAESVDLAVSTVLGRRWAISGPVESADMGGLDVFQALMDQICPSLCNAGTAPDILRRKRAEGRLGMKSGGGFYEWSDERARQRREERARALAEYVSNRPKPGKGRL